MKELPRNTDAETWLLGSVFQHPKIMARFSPALNPCDFYEEKNRMVWEAMQNLQKSGRPIDLITVGAELKDRSQFKSLFGDNDYIFSLSESVSSHANAEYYVDLIAKSSALRKIIFASQKTINEAYDTGASADELLAVAIERLAEITRGSTHADEEHLADVARRVLDRIRDRMEQGIAMGSPTGFMELDSLTGGLRSGEIIILGARPGMGKTSLALDIALNAAKTMPVKFFSLEMADKQFAPKALSFYSQVNLKDTINANVSEAELASQYKAVERLEKINIYAEFKADMKISEICAESHAFASRHGAGLVVIDHLHYLRTDDKKYENRNIELGKITHALKELAKKLEIPILLLSQLNRDIDRAAAKDKKPRLSDLRDSGNIEQDADMVWFLHRAGYYDKNASPSEAEIIIAKNRSGPTGEVKLNFDTGTTKFSDRKISDSPVNWS